MDTMPNGCFGKIDYHPVHTTTNQNPPKMDVVTETFLGILLVAMWIVRHFARPSDSSDDLCFLFCLLLLLYALYLHYIHSMYIVQYNSVVGFCNRICNSFV